MKYSLNSIFNNVMREVWFIKIHVIWTCYCAILNVLFFWTIALALIWNPVMSDDIAPKVISTLGGVGLEAINRLFGTHYKLADVVACPLSLSKFTLFPLYHPSPRVVYTRRPLDQQKRDFRKLMKTLAITTSVTTQVKGITA